MWKTKEIKGLGYHLSMAKCHLCMAKIIDVLIRVYCKVNLIIYKNKIRNVKMYRWLNKKWLRHISCCWEHMSYKYEKV